MTLNAADLDRLVRLEEPVVSRTATGQETVTWTLRHSVWAAVWPARGREYFNRDHLRAEGDTVIKIRASSQTSALTAKWRIVDGSTIYNIAAPPSDWRKRGEHLEIPCVTGVNEG